MMISDDARTFDLTGLRVPKKTGGPGGQGSQKLGGDPFRSLLVCPFTIIIDTREQLPYTFDGMECVVPTITKGLTSGDYSVAGMTDAVAVERKSLEDLYGSVTWGRERFEREIERLNSFKSAFVVIEATWPEIMDPASHRPGWENRTDPQSVEGTITAWSIRYNRVHWWACGGRRDAELRTFSILKKFWEEQQK